MQRGACIGRGAYIVRAPSRVTLADDVFELARTKQLPFAVSAGHPRRLFIAASDLSAWKQAAQGPECEGAQPQLNLFAADRRWRRG
jgi:hypothetical protein